MVTSFSTHPIVNVDSTGRAVVYGAFVDDWICVVLDLNSSDPVTVNIIGLQHTLRMWHIEKRQTE